MIRKVLFAVLLATQFAAISNIANAYMPYPQCYPCPTVR